MDDYKPEADGAREQGFISFLIDHTGNSSDAWTIQSLTQLIDFAKGRFANEGVN